jgi:hypothetical protein
MRRRIALTLAATAALAACDNSADKGPPPSAATTAAAASVTPVATASAAATCAPAPTLAETEFFTDPREEYGEDTARFKQLAANFAAAYKKACDAGLLAKAPLVPTDVAHPGMLFLVNAPDANDAAIYRDNEDGEAPNDMVLEYHFIPLDGKTYVPSEADLSEAIFCEVHGASDDEQDESGRCLVD